MSIFTQVVSDMKGLYPDLTLDPSEKTAVHSITTDENLILYDGRDYGEWEVSEKNTDKVTAVKDIKGATKLIVLEFISTFKDFNKGIKAKPPIENLKDGGFDFQESTPEVIHEPVEAEVLSDAEKLAMLDDIMDGRATPANVTHTHTPTKPSNPRVNMPAFPLNVSTKQVMELTQQDIINYICPEATPQEAMIFLKLCQARDINPFLKEAYLIKYKPSDPASMVVARDYFTRKADEYPEYDGYQAGIIIKKGDGSLERREGTFMMSPEELVGGWCKVYRNDRTKPHLVEVALKEYQQRKNDGSLNRFWNDKTGKPATMIRKVAVSQCHREAFPGKFSGMYDSSEIAGGMEALEDSIIEAVYQEVEA